MITHIHTHSISTALTQFVSNVILEYPMHDLRDMLTQLKTHFIQAVLQTA